MATVGRPVHGVNLGEMALEGALGLHELVLGDGLVSLLGDGPDWRKKRRSAYSPEAGEKKQENWPRGRDEE